MKRVACVGSLGTEQNLASDHSAQIIGLYNDMRVVKHQGALSGLFLIYQDSFLLVLEGQDQCVASAAYKIRRDARVSQCSIFANQTIEAPWFSHWKVKFFKPEQVSHQQLIDALAEQVLVGRQFVDEASRQRFESLVAAAGRYKASPNRGLSREAESASPGSLESAKSKAEHGASAAADVPSDRGDFSDAPKRNLRHACFTINAWPKPGQVALSAGLMRSCALLSKQRIHYNDLLARGFWSDEQALDEFLLKLDQLNVLIVHDQQSASESAKYAAVASAQVVSTDEVVKEVTARSQASADEQQDKAEESARTGDRFSALMRRFLSSARQAG